LTNFSNPVVQQNIEEYQEIALTSWLPQILQNNDPASTQATQKLAELLEEQHSDSWLRDFLRFTKPLELQAVTALSAAVFANRQGLYSHALAQSKTADQLFAGMDNVPGQLQAQFEQVYALRSMLLGRDCLSRVIALRKKLSGRGYQRLQAQAILEESQCRNFTGENAEAFRDSRESLTVAGKFGFPILVLRVMGIDASIRRQQKRCDEGWKESARGIGFYWRGIYPAERLDQFYAVMWQCALDSGHLYTAEALLRHTLEMRTSPDGNIPRNEIREGILELHLKNILMARGESALAEQERKRALSKLEGLPESYAQNFRLTTEFDPAEHQLTQQDAELALSTLKPVEQMLRATQDDFFALRFYRLMGNIYVHLRKLDEASAAFEAAIQMAETSLSTLRTDKDRSGWLRATSDSYRGLVRVLLEQKKESEALARWEWYKSRFLPNDLLSSDPELSDRNGSDRSQRNQFRPVLPRASETRVVYASFEDGLQIWVYRGRQVHSRWIDIRQGELRQAAEEFTRLCSSPSSNLDALQKRGERLYLLLLQPIMSELPEKGTLVIEPDSPTSDLPLGALKGPTGHYLEEKYSIVYSPGVWMEQNLRLSAPIETRDSLLVVDASHSPAAGSLPGASMERKTISNLFPQATIVDSESTSWNAVRPKLAASEIFVFIGHGRPDGSGAVLAFNSRESLSAKDFSQSLLTHAKLAVLSACSSGVGKDDGPLDTENLVYSFLSARVPSIVASHWNVDSAMTARLMSSFYLHLKQEKIVVQALADARRDMLREMPHPYYWAGFTLTGRAN